MDEQLTAQIKIVAVCSNAARNLNDISRNLGTYSELLKLIWNSSISSHPSE